MPGVNGWPMTVLVPGIRAAFFWLDDDRDIALAEAAASLAPDEAERAARFVQDLHRHRFIRGRGFLRRTLGDLLGIGPTRVDLALTGNGKPALSQGGPHFNLSHAGAAAVLALRAEGPVGIDIEPLERSLDVVALGEQVFTDAENARLRAAAGADDRQYLFLSMWTAKEARMKLTGEGMSLAPKAISLRFGPAGPTGYDLPADPPARLAYVQVPFDRHVCCLAWTPAAEGCVRPD
jgi:4'-phosphopantetheinyl transferase